MKILHITPAYHPAIQWGGPAVSVRLLAREQKKLGYDVKVFTSALGIGHNKTQTIEVDGLFVTYFRFFAIGHWFISWPFLWGLWKHRDDFDVFHIHLVWDPISWMSGILLRLSRKKVVYSPRGTVEAELITKKSFLLKRIIYTLFVRNLFKAAHAIHFTAQDEKDKFLAFTGFEPKHNAIVINPFDPEPFEHPVESEDYNALGLERGKYFLYFARVNWKKRLEVLLMAFQKFSKVHPGYNVVCAGATDSDYGERLSALAAELGISDKFVFIQRSIPVYDDLKIALFRNTNAFVLPSYSENFGFVAVEAMASGVPLIMSDGVAIKDLVLRYNAGRVFKGSNIPDEQAAVNLLHEMEYVHEPARRASLIENGKKLVEQEFDNVKIARQVIELYQ